MPDLVPNTTQLSDGTVFDDTTGSRLVTFLIAKLRQLGVLLTSDSTLTGATGSANAIIQNVNVTQSGTAGFTAWLLNVTLAAVGSGTKLLMDLQVAGATMFRVTSTGIATAAGGLVATAGNITAIAGDVVISTLGKGLQIKTGTSSRIGSATLVGGTVIVTNTSVTANTKVFFNRTLTGGTVGFLSATKSNGASFTLTSSSGTDTSTMDWMLVEAIV